jgi:hypothetical protein
MLRWEGVRRVDQGRDPIRINRRSCMANYKPGVIQSRTLSHVPVKQDRNWPAKDPAKRTGFMLSEWYLDCVSDDGVV